MIIFAVLSLLVLSYGCAGVRMNESQPSQDKKLVKNLSLRVGVIIDKAPLAYQSALGGLVGSEIELIRKFTKMRGIRLTLSEYPKEDLFIALRRGDIDIAIPSTTEEEISAKFLSPCAAHSETGQRLLANASVAPYITELKQIDNPNVRVYSVIGSTSARFAKKFFKAADVASLESIEQCVKKVLNDNGCLCLTDEVTANILLKKYNERSSKKNGPIHSS
jgi:ABC-type amino acid transport substrate-binding protein